MPCNVLGRRSFRFSESRSVNEPQTTGKWPTAPAPPRSPWQLFYSAAHRLRRSWWRTRARHLPVPVISIGNLHWGGTGKTPMVAAVARHFIESGRSVTLLSRGYGRQGRRELIASRGSGSLGSPAEIGDEPAMLADSVAGLSVVVGADRFEAGQLALSQLNPRPDLFILDDGFSHVALARDLDLLTFPVSDPWAGGRLPPGGRLREPLESARWADAVLLTGNPEGSGEALARALRPFGFEGPGFSVASRVDARNPGDGSVFDLSHRAVLLVTGVARPERVHESATACGAEVRDHLRLADHHDYPDSTLEEIVTRFRSSNAECIVTTSKDLVKLANRLDLPLIELRLTAEPQSTFWDWLDQSGSISKSGSPLSTA